ncbi:MAG TPA: ferredoxin [Afifellaceae bacterium]|nr:ferredoxin [Afifellaceae bacterium]
MPGSRSYFDVDHLAAALRPHGLIPRGGFALTSDDGLGEGTLVMVGNAGPDMWAAFAQHAESGPDPLDRWTKRAIDPLAERFGAQAVYPFDRPHPPFQRWAMRAEGLRASPLGILIHPDYGLWHAYRAALVVPGSVEGASADIQSRHPCDSCSEKPCLNACPVDAFTPGGYDVPACAAYLSSAAGESCKAEGCAARNACPVGPEFRYPEPQVRFHMAAFSRSVTAG